MKTDNTAFRATYDEFAKTIGLENAEAEGRYSYRLLLPWIKPGARILDIGCGRGSILNPLANRGIKIVGLDYSPASVALLNEHGKNAICGSATSPLPFDEDSFDIVLCYELLEHLTQAQIDSAIENAKSILRPGGKIIFTVPKDENLKARMIACPHCKDMFHIYGHLTSFSKKKIMDLAERKKLKVRKIHRIYGIALYKLHVPLWIIRILSLFDIRIKTIQRPIGSFMVILEKQ